MLYRWLSWLTARESENTRLLNAILDRQQDLYRHVLQCGTRINRLEKLIMAFREDFDAAETRLEGLISEAVTAIQSLPSSADDLTQADLDRVKAQGDALAAVFPSTPAIPDPSEPTDPPVDEQ
jgi:hypothetical protein